MVGSLYPDEIADDGAQFEISTYIDAEGYYPIVGDSKIALNVKKNGINIIVSELDSQPYIYLDRGKHDTGSFLGMGATVCSSSRTFLYFAK